MDDLIDELLTSKNKRKRVTLETQINNDISEEDDLEVLTV